MALCNLDKVKKKAQFLGSYPTKRQNLCVWRDDNEEIWKGNASLSNVTDTSVHFLIVGVCGRLMCWHGIGRLERWGGGEVTKAKIKHVTTYQHTLAEGSSTPASCPLSRPPSLDPPVGNLGNKRKWGHRPLRTAIPFWCCKVEFQDLRMAPNHNLENREKKVWIFSTGK